MSFFPAGRLVVAATLVLCALAAPSDVRAQGSRVIFEDDFQANTSNWQSASKQDVILIVANGRLSLETTASGTASWATPAVTVPDDIDIQVEATVVDPNPNGEWNLALILRADTRDLKASFYHFGITGGGFWEFSVRPKDAQTYVNNLKSGKLSPLPDFTQPITLKVSARGNQFTFFVNGREIDTFEDYSVSHKPGVETYIGLMSGTYADASSNEVQFRKLVVTQPAADEMLLVENFGQNNPNGWGLGDNDNSTVTLDNNALNFRINKANVLSWSRPEVTFPSDIDLTVKVTAEKLEDSTAWSYGVGVRGYREQEQSFFYLFEIRASGEFTFTTQRGGVVLATLISLTKLQNFNPYAENTLRVVAKGDSFTLYVNGKQVGTAKTDSSLKTQTQYTLVLAAGTFEANTAKVAFSDLVVRVAK